jgi:hypothetical protein
MKFNKLLDILTCEQIMQMNIHSLLCMSPLPIRCLGFLWGNLAPTYEFWISPAMLHEHWYVFTCQYLEIDLVESWDC